MKTLTALLAALAVLAATTAPAGAFRAHPNPPPGRCAGPCWPGSNPPVRIRPIDFWVSRRG